MAPKKRHLIAKSEIILYSDLKIKESGGVVTELGIIDFEVYEEKPEKCNDCKSFNVIGLEVLGAKEGILFWICDDCENLHLKYDLEETKAYLEKGKGYWTNKEDWAVPPSDQMS